MGGFSINRLVFAVMLGAALLLAACGGDSGGDNGELPTRFVLPAVSATATFTSTSVPLPTTIAEAALAEATITEAGVTPTAATFSPPTVTPSTTITDTPMPTSTPTPIPTLDPGPVDFLAELARNATVLPREMLTNAPPQPGIAPTQPSVPLPPGVGMTLTPNTGVSCQYMPPGGFGALLLNQPQLFTLIGCPVGTPPDTLSLAAAYQPFEGGAMYWLDEGPGYITVLYTNGTFQRFEDTFTDGVDPVSGGETPPDDRFEPVRGFGKVWRDNPVVRDALGWATQVESGTQATVQNFDSGRMLSLPTRGDILVLAYQGSPATGTWQAAPGSF